jgi:aminoglycoside phosphotransferase (APT) family kinase protein
METGTTARLREALRAWLTTVFGAGAEVHDLVCLAGGASQEAWSFTFADRRLVLRRDMGGSLHDYGTDRYDEYRVIQTAHRAGVLVPEPLAYTDDLLGRAAFVMEHVDGETIGRRLVSQPQYAAIRPVLIEQIATNLARIHCLDPAELAFLPGSTDPRTAATTELDRFQAQLDRLGEPHPALELGLRWLRRHLPETDRVALVHGDFRTGNFIVRPDTGLAGILDWEFAHLGDPLEDLGWLCVRAWRFGADDRPAGGLTDRDTLFRAYERASGTRVEAARMRWWELFGNVRWAIGALGQAARHLDGLHRSVELASLGRICAEVELEALRMIGELEP